MHSHQSYRTFSTTPICHRFSIVCIWHRGAKATYSCGEKSGNSGSTRQNKKPLVKDTLPALATFRRGQRLRRYAAIAGSPAVLVADDCIAPQRIRDPHVHIEDTSFRPLRGRSQPGTEFVWRACHGILSARRTARASLVPAYPFFRRAKLAPVAAFARGERSSSRAKAATGAADAR